MSNYNSENTTVLATHEQAGGNTRMLLLHVCDSGRHEYVIGSYFTEKWNPIDDVRNYEWDWGHYFSELLPCVDYWRYEVLGIDGGDETGKAL